ncbi:hypothetical protein COHA_001917 [Chlorella ohadii]|uniref:Protein DETOXIFICATION n=1 Tax=Chlorella ohadii TaxID=2649997 RepID=A0AAD5E1K2_9CHLO|nr:hypothetical protein COHA_001917 [Chlorella ohadii]
MPGPGEYCRVSISGATSKMARAASFSMGQRPRAQLDNGVPGPGAFSPPLPPRPSSAAYSFHGVEDRSASRRAAEVPGPGAYCPERAERLTRPASPGAAMHPRLDPAYLQRVDVFASPTSYSPRRPGDGLQRGTSFSRGRGHQGTVPASHATCAATDGLASGSCGITGPGSYSPKADLGKLRSVSFSFGQRTALRDPPTHHRYRGPLQPSHAQSGERMSLQADESPQAAAAAAEPAAAAATAADAAAPAGASPPATTAAQPWTQQQRLAEVLRFCLPVVLVPLADPIMSLIDTICLGRMASSLELAALGPASLLLTFSNYILFALSVGTVSLIAERLKQQDTEAAGRTLSGSLFLAAMGGLSMGLLFLQFGPQLLRLTGADPAVLAYAATYLHIRALALPAVITVAQAGLLAQRDSLSPFRVVLATSAASLAGDLLFIGRMGLGVAGAAWTTVLAQYLGAMLLLRTLRRSAVRPRLLVPSGAELRALLDTFGVLTIFYAAKNLCYLLLQSTAAQLSALVLAAHQPIWSLWCLVSFTNTPLESAALAFLPAAPSREDAQETARLLILLGAASGVIGSAVAVGLPAVAPQLFTANTALWPNMQSVQLQGVLAMLCCGVDVAANGVLLALKDTAFVARAMATCLLVLLAFLAWARTALPGLPAVWWGLCVFFACRAAQSLPRALTQLGMLGGSGQVKADSKAPRQLVEPA